MASVKITRSSAWVNAGRGTTLPDGVTLQDIDGGPDYFSQWSATEFLDDPTFFPISVFLPYDFAATVNPYGTPMSRVESHQDAGINLYVGLGASDPTDHQNDLEAAIAADMPVIFDPTEAHLDSAFLATYGDHIIGWQWSDELDGASCAAPILSDPGDQYAFLRPGATCVDGIAGKNDYTILQTMSNTIRAIDPDRPVYMGYTNAFAMNWFTGGPVSRLADAGDILGYDVYVLVDTRSTFGGILDVGHPWAAAQVTSFARANASYSRPIWPDIESSATDTNSGMNPTLREPTPDEEKALAWGHIIGGARGLCWFNHSFSAAIPGATSNDDLNNPHYADLREAIKAVNADIMALAPILNSPFAVGYFTSSGVVYGMAKWHEATGEFYIFALSGQVASQDVTFTVAGGESPVTVVNEARTIPLVDGQFTDTFAGETAVHIYRIRL